jgi:uncharacterized repeat protein (TIGR01451 family)
MVGWQLIPLAVVLSSAWTYRQTETQQGFSKHNFWLHPLGLAIISLCLTLGVAAMPLAFGWGHLFLPVFLGWLLLECVKPSQRIHRKTLGRMSPQRQRQWLGLSLGSAIALLLLWQIAEISIFIRVGLSLPLFCGFFTGVMAPFIRLRAWVMAGLIAFSTFGAVFLEGTIGQPSQAQTVTPKIETLVAGAYIIDMGQATQTVANGLKPYGLVYELVVQKAIPVKWAIDPNKAREGVDFSANGKSYRGGSFIIPAEYATEASSSIAGWKAQGVVIDGPLASSFNAPIFTTITGFPNAVLDFQNGSIAQAYYTNAGIPASSTGTFGSFNTYRFGYPSSLTSCDDLFVMPHADPTWANHQNLISFTQSKGFIWAACHAVSVLERIDDPGDADTLPDMNFLSHIPPAITDSKSLKLFGLHALPTVGPYQYASVSSSGTPYGYGNTNLWAYPIMQFLGKIDLATQNGSEQVYIPDTSGAQWRDTSTIAVYDDNNTDAVALPTKGITPPSSQIKAAKMVYGPGFGNPNNGLVMYEAGHSHAKATLPDNIAAQRAFFNYVLLSGIVRGMTVVANVPDTVNGGQTVPLSASVTGGSGSYSYQWYSNCGGTFSNTNTANPTFTAPAKTGACTVRVVVTDGCKHKGFGTHITIVSGPKAELGITQTDGQTVAKLGAPITYTLTVVNNGPSTVNSLQVTDNIPTTILNPVFTPSTGAFSYTSSSGIGNWSGLSLAAGQSITLTLKGTVSTTATVGSSLTNTATVAPLGGLTDSDTTNNSSTDTDTIQNPQASITVTKDDGVTETSQDGNLSYTIRVTNTGPDPVTNLTVEDQIIRFKDNDGKSPTGTDTTTSDKGGKDVMDKLSLTVSKGTLSPTLTAFDTNLKSIFTSNFTNLTWQNVNLAPNESATFILTGQVKVDNTQGALRNTVQLTPLGPSGSAIGTAVSASDTDNMIPRGTEVALKVTKSVTPASPLPAPGENITYSILVENTKNSADDAIVTDNIPTAISNVSWTCAITAGTAPATQCNQTSGGVDANNTLRTTADLANGGKITYTVTGKIAPSFTGTLTNTATVTPKPGQYDNSPGDNEEPESSALTRKAALVVTKNDGLTSVAPGQAISYTITAKNKGPSTINSIKLTDVIPTIIQNPSFAVNQGSFSPTKTAGTPNDTWTGDWTNLTLTPGNSATDTATLTVSGTVATTASGNLTNTVTLAAPTGAYTLDTANSTLTASDTDTVQPTADLEIANTDGQTTAVPGQSIGYTLTVKNNGPSPVSSVKITDSVPATILNSNLSSLDGANLNTTSGYWEGLNLQTGDSTTFVLAGTIDPAATGNLTNTAIVASPTGVVDPNSANNSSTDTDTLTPTADISISKSDGKPAVNPGDAITYTVKVTNNGPSAVSNAILTDTVPNNITGVTWTCATTVGNSVCGATSGSGNAINTTVTLANGATATYTIQGTVSPTAPNPGTLTNTASVSLPLGTTDSNLTNNSSTDSDTIPIPTGIVDLSITKNDGLTEVVPGSPVTYSIEVINNSPTVTLYGVKVTEVLPPASQLENVFFSSPNGPYDAATGEWDITLPPGETALLLVDGAVPLTASSGSLTNKATVYPPNGFTDPDCPGNVCSGNNIATDTDTLIGPSSSSPNVLLVKRITGINGDPSSNPNDSTPLDQIENLTTGPQANDDDHPNWPNSYLQGSIHGGRVKLGDRVDYTIYFLSAGDKNAAKVKICDRIPQNQTFVSTTFGIDRGIQVERSGQTLTYTNRIDGDASAFYAPGQSLPSFCGVDGSDPNLNPTGAIVVDLGTLPKSNGPGTPSGSYGFINFRAKVD